MSRLSEQVHDMARSSSHRRKKHHELSTSVINRQMGQVDKLHAVIEECNPFQNETDDLVNIVTQAVMPEKIKLDILKSEVAGRNVYEEFIKKRIAGPTSPWEKMTRLNLLPWKSAARTTKVKLATDVVELKENRSLFARLLIIARSRPEVDLPSTIGTYEFSCIPRSLFASDGSVLICTDKYKLMAILEGMAPEYYSEPLDN